MRCGCLTASNVNRHETLANDTPEVGSGNELLPHIAALGETDGIQAIQVVLQRDGMTCNHMSARWLHVCFMHIGKTSRLRIRSMVPAQWAHPESKGSQLANTWLKEQMHIWVPAWPASVRTEAKCSLDMLPWVQCLEERKSTFANLS